MKFEQSLWNEKMMCGVVVCSHNFKELISSIVVCNGHKTDMYGCIDYCRTANPSVSRINVYDGSAMVCVYQKTHKGEWEITLKARAELY